MQAKPTKVPLGGSFWLFMAGLVLEISVSAVAARATVVQILEQQGLGIEVPARPQARQKAEPARAVADTLAAGVGTLRSRCYEQGYAEGLLPAAAWPIEIAVRADGTVDTVRVDGPGVEMRKCIERQAASWRFGPQPKPLVLTHTLSFASETP